MKENIFKFSGKVVKQGNSLCVRIPNFIKKELNIEENSEVRVTLEKAIYKYNEAHIDYILGIANNVRKLDVYSSEKKRFFVYLNFKYVENVGDKTEKEQLEYLKKLKKEFGDKLIKEWLYFEMILSKEAFITDHMNYCVLKPEYDIGYGKTNQNKN